MATDNQWRSTPYRQPFAGQAFGMQGPAMYGGMGLAQRETAPVQQAPVEDIFDDAAFERAFDAARWDVQDQTEQHADAVREQSVLLDESAANLMMQESLEDFERITADAVVERQEEEAEQTESTDRDDLARTAGELLNSVRDNTSQKFQQSSFLALMRQLRDHEVIVEGNSMVEVGQPSSVRTLH